MNKKSFRIATMTAAVIAFGMVLNAAAVRADKTIQVLLFNLGDSPADISVTDMNQDFEFETKLDDHGSKELAIATDKNGEGSIKYRTKFRDSKGNVTKTICGHTMHIRSGATVNISEGNDSC